MPVSQVQAHCHLVPAPSSPAEGRDLLRFSLLSALAHIIALILLAIWGGGNTKVQPPPRMITVDLSQTKPLQPQVAPRLADAQPPKPVQRPSAPVPIRPVKAIKPRSVAITAKPLPVPPPRQTAPVTAQTSSPQRAVRWGIPATPSGAPSEIPSGTLSGIPSEIPPKAAVPVSGGATRMAASSRPATASSPATSGTSGQTADRAGIRTGYVRQCRTLIERHKEYPVMAKKGMIEGTVLVQGKLARDGVLRQCIVTRSSGSGLLDNAALRAVRSVGRFPPLPVEIQGDELFFELPVSFQLSSE